MALATGDCKTIGEKWPTEFKAIQREMAVPSSPSKSSSPANATRRSRLFTGVVGPFRAWKLPLGTCTKNRRVTSTIKMKNINLACLALMALSLPFPAIAANEVFALPFSVAAKRQARQPYPNMCFPKGASPQAKKYRQTKLLERAQRYGYPGGRSRLLSLCSQAPRSTREKSHLLLVRVFCIYLCKLVFSAQESTCPSAS
jgi:hypothetical protein